MLQSPKVINIFLLLALIASCRANNNLQMKYEWKQIDFNYESADERKEAIDNQTFIPVNVIPTGIDVHENRLFISLPRLKSGVPASLATINMDGEFIFHCYFELIEYLLFYRDYLNFIGYRP